MKYDNENIGENGYTKEWNEYMPIIKGLFYSLVILSIFGLISYLK